MQIYGPNYLHGPQGVQGPHAARPAQKQAQTSQGKQIQDEVQLSAEAQQLEDVDSIPGIRHDRVKELRAQIEAGTYETPEKLDAALERMLDEIA